MAVDTRLPSFSRGDSSERASLHHLAVQEDSAHNSNKVVSNLSRGNITAVPVLIKPVFPDSKEDAPFLGTMAPGFSNPQTSQVVISGWIKRPMYTPEKFLGVSYKGFEHDVSK